MVTDINQLDLEKKYTYADYLTWQFDEMVELIRGKVFRMSPAPSEAHQWVVGAMHAQIFMYLKGKNCKSYPAPFDVRLELPIDKQTDKKNDTVVQPDICIICDLSKIDKSGCKGAPDLIIEILSKGTARKDLTEKYKLYEHAGVKEYWIVRPYEQTVSPFLLDDQGSYQAMRDTPFVHGEKVPVGIFPGFEVDLGEVFGG